VKEPEIFFKKEKIPYRMRPTREERRELPARVSADMQKITLTSLPLDALVTVVSHLDSLSLLTVATVNRTLRAAAEDESLWSARARRYLGPVLHAYFGGELPSRPPGAGAKQGYFALYAGWKQLAQERSGRLLLKIGKPRSRGDWAGEWQRWQTGTYQTSSGASAVCFGLPTSQCEAYGVFDATDFDHPGSNELLGQAAARPDASDAFRLCRHSGLGRGREWRGERESCA